MIELEQEPVRSELRRFAALIVIVTATGFALGHALRQPTQMGANDISRWCTVWSLLEKGSYVIDECPWQVNTQDKVYHAPEQIGIGSKPVKHYYSSKPALLPTLIAGILYPARMLTGVPLDRVVLEPRSERWTQIPDPGSPYGVKGVLETPKDPVRWPVYIFYFKPIIVLSNVIPYGLFLVFFSRLLDRYAANDWSWLFCLVAAAFGTYLLPFTQTLNNHTIAAFSVFFALYSFLCVWDAGDLRGWRFAAAGFLGAFAATNELPALAFLAALFGLLVIRFPKKTLAWFVPAAAIPIAAFFAAQYAVFGAVKLAYEAFGTDEYLYEGSLWKTPLDLDAFNERPEPYGVYLFHMTLGHHGVFSLTPLFLFSVWGAGRLIRKNTQFATILRRGGEPLVALAWLATVLTVVVLAFYTWNPKARNYGGSTQGLRWLFWMIPFWLILLPKGVEAGQNRGWVRNLALLRAGSLGDLGWLRHPQPLDSSLDPGWARAPGSVPLEAMRMVAMSKLFADRADAGRVLAEKLAAYQGRDDVIVLGLPRGGVPVAYEAARALEAPLDVFLVRKLGAPGQEELAMGAIASDDIVVINEEVVRALKIAPQVVDAEAERERGELARREAIYHEGRPTLDVSGKTVILIDDGLATGSTMRAAVVALRRKDPARIVVAVPIGAASTCAELQEIADECICVVAPEHFRAVGLWYDDFAQTTDDEVCDLLVRGNRPDALQASHEPIAPTEAKPWGSIDRPEATSKTRILAAYTRDVGITAGERTLLGTLTLPQGTPAVVIFAHGSGSGRFSPRNQQVAHDLHEAGLGTLLLDLLEESEAGDRAKVFDIALLADRLRTAARWLVSQSETAGLGLGYFGASTGAGAALLAAAEVPDPIGAIVSRGGRPDLARNALSRVAAPTLLIVGSNDEHVLKLNRAAYALLKCPRRLEVIPGASHLFPEPGALEEVSRLAREWFLKYLSPSAV